MGFNSVFKGLNEIECRNKILSFFLFSVFDPFSILIVSVELIFALYHAQTHHIRYNSSGRVIGLSQTLVPNNTQHSKGQTSRP